MISKILIANRGEIASRIIRTCRALDIRTVSVYSEADQDAPFAAMADERFLIGPPKVQESYMDVDKLMAIAHKSNADAIHPGYGFLSENASFAKRCTEEGLTFIGPSSDIIEIMGNKIAARKAMEAADVPVVPGTKEAVSTVEEALDHASDIGYPIMLKASAGGGGIGMQIVRSDEELEKAFATNSKRAETLFGDGSMFMEKKIDDAHHIEIQVIADHHGNAFHLFDRECSIQRRNQKVIEEAPSPFLSENTREIMGETAVNAVRSLGYTNAGTIEFLVDDSENFYFLEMNTRIQVEHPVTEEVTGMDIVALQIQIANDKKLPFIQDSIVLSSHAIEARIYAEDPERFLPSPGHISEMQLPEGEGIRNETGVKSNFEVTPFYDPMIGKLIVKGETRDKAIEKLQRALSDYRIEGIRTNLAMLRKIADLHPFQKGMTTTAFIDTHYLPLIKQNSKK